MAEFCNFISLFDACCDYLIELCIVDSYGFQISVLYNVLQTIMDISGLGVL